MPFSCFSNSLRSSVCIVLLIDTISCYVRSKKEWHFTHLDLKVTVSHTNLILCIVVCYVFPKSYLTLITLVHLRVMLICSPVYSDVCIYPNVNSIQYLIFHLYSNVTTSTRNKFYKCTYVHPCLFHWKRIQYSTIGIFTFTLQIENQIKGFELLYWDLSRYWTWRTN